jgi:hypothetical protein
MTSLPYPSLCVDGCAILHRHLSEFSSATLVELLYASMALQDIDSCMQELPALKSLLRPSSPSARARLWSSLAKSALACHHRMDSAASVAFVELLMREAHSSVFALTRPQLYERWLRQLPSPSVMLEQTLGWRRVTTTLLARLAEASYAVTLPERDSGSGAVAAAQLPQEGWSAYSLAVVELAERAHVDLEPTAWHYIVLAQSNPSNALDVIEDMLRRQVLPLPRTLARLLDNCVQQDQLQLARRLLRNIENLCKHQCTVTAANSLLRAFLTLGEVERAAQLYASLDHQDTPTDVDADTVAPARSASTVRPDQAPARNHFMKQVGQLRESQAFPELAQVKPSAATHIIVMEAALEGNDPNTTLQLFNAHRHRMPTRGYELYARALTKLDRLNELEQVLPLAKSAGVVSARLVWTLVRCFGELSFEAGLFHMLRRVREEISEVDLNTRYLQRGTRLALIKCDAEHRWSNYRASFFQPRARHRHATNDEGQQT